MKATCWSLPVALLGFVVALGVSGCGGGLQRAPTFNGQRVVLSVLVQPLTPQDTREAARMERHLIRVLSGVGYQAGIIRQPNQHIAGPGRFLVTVQIRNANPYHLSTQYYISDGRTTLFTGSYSRGSGRGIRALIESANVELANAVSNGLRSTGQAR